MRWTLLTAPVLAGAGAPGRARQWVFLLVMIPAGVAAVHLQGEPFCLS